MNNDNNSIDSKIDNIAEYLRKTINQYKGDFDQAIKTQQGLHVQECTELKDTISKLTKDQKDKIKNKPGPKVPTVYNLYIAYMIKNETDNSQHLTARIKIYGRAWTQEKNIFIENKRALLKDHKEFDEMGIKTQITYLYDEWKKHVILKYKLTHPN